ncbi:phosphotransferase [Paenibacillus sp. sptzw28]|uniref:phosphotransferase n=1 Tax=Paenibacillus sp. sptzw28 TaxID=715179 RepID=UPI001C6EA59B|nr:phosphotransferase [Paenibacillus sp. sptzw28]QYR22581.1 phosphotransferase [Paenibacillus sp. sptzw28]
MNKGALIGRGLTAEVFEWGENRVIKLFFSSVSQDWIDREAKTGAIAAAAGIPSPSVYETIEVEGRKGIIYDRLKGSSMLKLIQAEPGNTWLYGRRMAELHARVHQSDGTGKLQLQKEIIAGAVRDSAALLGERTKRICEYLGAMPKGSSICHGDFHPDNIIVNGQSIGIIDWMNACIGDPLGDAARTCLMINSPYITPDIPASMAPVVAEIKRVLLDNYREEYLRLTGAHQDELKAWMLPIAAARLRENVPGESEWLMCMIDELLSE